MALKIVWTNQAIQGLEKVLDYLEKYWSTSEIISLEKNLIDLLNRISKYPEICPATSHLKDVRKGLIDRNNYIIYRINSRSNSIEIINFRGTKQNDPK
jgi:plasmid stabilization system protein ParE